MTFRFTLVGDSLIGLPWPSLAFDRLLDPLSFPRLRFLVWAFWRAQLSPVLDAIAFGIAHAAMAAQVDPTTERVAAEGGVVAAYTIACVRIFSSAHTTDASLQTDSRLALEIVRQDLDTT